MSHTKAGGSTKLGRDSASKRLGVKIFGGQAIEAGSIIVRQRGTKMVSGPGTLVGRDHTIYAAKTGTVAFAQKQHQRFTGQSVVRTVVVVT